ncbi:uncharacterized protein MONOS_18453 [Monocercomonoides exilis]|uniref:uncharacterized protein n=1 Tax=Monocercomonoides exilis TaxID=2049356 RepID=UPI00355A34B5|nr:hypothetical protein MONOS_18453 [Monocercomonoides exilis]
MLCGLQREKSVAECVCGWSDLGQWDWNRGNTRLLLDQRRRKKKKKKEEEEKKEERSRIRLSNCSSGVFGCGRATELSPAECQCGGQRGGRECEWEDGRCSRNSDCGNGGRCVSVKKRHFTSRRDWDGDEGREKEEERQENAVEAERRKRGQMGGERGKEGRERRRGEEKWRRWRRWSYERRMRDGWLRRSEKAMEWVGCVFGVCVLASVLGVGVVVCEGESKREWLMEELQEEAAKEEEEVEEEEKEERKLEDCEKKDDEREKSEESEEKRRRKRRNEREMKTIQMGANGKREEEEEEEEERKKKKQ